MNKERLIRNLEAELLKIERQDKIYGVGETRYDLMIKDVLNYIENSIPKEVVKENLESTQSEYIKALSKINREELTNISTSTYKAIKLEVKRGILQELLEGK